MIHWRILKEASFSRQGEGALLNPGFSSEGALCLLDGRIAQVVEQLTLNQRVGGSSPSAPTNDFNMLSIDR